MSDKPDLKPCPFCDGGNSVISMLPRGWGILVHHKKGCAIESLKGVQVSDLNDFAEAWNTRHDSSSGVECSCAKLISQSLNT